MPHGWTAQTRLPSISSIQIRPTDADISSGVPASTVAATGSTIAAVLQSMRTIVDVALRTSTPALPAIDSRSPPSMPSPAISTSSTNPSSPTHHNWSSPPSQPQSAVGPGVCSTISLIGTPSGIVTQSPPPRRTRRRSPSSTSGEAPTSVNSAFGRAVSSTSSAVVVIRCSAPAANAITAPSGVTRVCCGSAAAPSSNGTWSPLGGSSTPRPDRGSKPTMPAWPTPTTALGVVMTLSDCGGPSSSAAVSIERAVADPRSSTATPLALWAISSSVGSPGTSSRASVCPENPSARTARALLSSTNHRVARGVVASIAGYPSARRATTTPVSASTAATTAKMARRHGTPVMFNPVTRGLGCGARSSLVDQPRPLPEHGDGLAQRHEVAALPALGVDRGVLGGQSGAAQLVAEAGVLVFELHHTSDAFEVHALLGELGDALQRLDVGVAVAAVTDPRAGGVDETTPLVDAQRLGVHSSELGGDRDHVHRLGSVPCAHDNFLRPGHRLVLGITVVAAASCSTAALRSSVSWAGTSTSTVTIRSPVVSPSRLELTEMPLPLTRWREPLGVPGRSRRVTVEPSIVGTSMSPPSAASENVIGSVTVRLLPERPKRASGRTWISTSRSPAGPPLRPGAPRPLRRIVCPSDTPAGMRARTSRGRRSMPAPWQVGQGSRMIDPRPWQLRHGVENENMPWLSSTTPRPPQTGQRSGYVPGLAPDPWHVEHWASLVNCSVVVMPRTASSKSSVSWAVTSAPRCGPTP